MKGIILVLCFIPALLFAECTTCKASYATNGGTGFDSNILKLADYDVTTGAFGEAEEVGCAQLVDCNLNGALKTFKDFGFDFIHVYPAIRCDSTTTDYYPILFTQVYRPIVRCVEQIINYIVERDHQDNKTTGNQCVYCEQIFNLRSDAGQTLLDRYQALYDAATNRTLKQRLMYLMDVIKKYGGEYYKTGATL